jgi:tripartite-type tricarboxylate transporter receptor subunit TctC
MLKMKLDRREVLHLAAAITALPAVPQDAWAQNYPMRPITVIVPFVAGGPTDVIARLYADAMSRILGQPFLIENVGGAGGTIGSTRGAKAAPDGYTLLVGHTGTLAANGAFYSKLPYDPTNDFEYIGSLGDAPQILIAKRDMSSTLKDFVEHTKANQAKMNYGTAGMGSAAHLGGAMLNVALGTQVLPVHYRGIAPAMNDLVAAQIDYMVDMSTTAIPQIQGGNVLPIAVLRSQRLSVIPAVPTSVETGVTNLDISIWNVMMAPKNTPRPIIDSLNIALRKAAAEPNVKASLAAIAVEMPDDNRLSSDGTRIFVKSEIERWVPALKRAGIAPID